jgi:hypothetical protein
MDFKLTVVANEPRFLNLFMKKLTRERVVPTISARVSSLILDFGNCDFGFFGPSRSAPAATSTSEDHLPVSSMTRLRRSSGKRVSVRLPHSGLSGIRARLPRFAKVCSGQQTGSDPLHW